MTPVSASAVEDFAAELRPRLGGNVRTAFYDRLLYATDASNYQIMPLAVALPHSTEDVIAVMEAAARYGLPVLPRGGGTSLSGQTVGEAVVVDMTRLDRILHVNPAEKWVKVEPGVVLTRLNNALKDRGLMFGPDPASADRAVIGGVMGNNSTGSHSILYGMAADHVIAMDVVLSDGTTATFGTVDAATIGRKAAQDTLEGRIYRHVPAIVQQNAQAILERLPNTWRRCGGYNLDRLLPGGTFDNVARRLPPLRLPPDGFNLAKLITGSEGTLAAILSVTVNLVPTPKKTTVVVLEYTDLNACLESIPALLEVDPSSVEMMDKLQMDLCRALPAWAPRLARFVSGDPEAILMVEFYGDNDAELSTLRDRLVTHVREHRLPVSAITPMPDAAAVANVWAVRKAGLGLLLSMKGDLKPVHFMEDVAVPVEHLAAYVRDLEQVAGELGTTLGMYAHASAGCLHIKPVLNLKTRQGVLAMEQIQRAVADLVLKYRGAMSSEHGDGLARSWLNRHIFGDQVYEAFRQVKAAFDPDNRMNPGKVVDAPAMTEHLRYGPDYTTIPLYEYLDWSADQGFARAVEMCNGAGVCRKLETGVMCPTFMVTREEEHSTRGRANLLRAALSGLIPREEMFTGRVAEALDLCISCKACKNECPSSVDMARIKLEWQVHRHKQYPPSLRTRLFAHMPLLSPLGSAFAPLANAVFANPLVKLGLDVMLGIDKRRQMPRFERAFTWTRREIPRTTGKAVVLYVDTWANFNETRIAQAAWDVLTAAGYEVIVPPYTCCGRTYLSKGFLPEARRCANNVMRVLAPYGRAGLPIIGLEPSCILTMRDEHQYLSDHPDRAVVGRCAVTFEEFAAQHMAEWADLFERDSGRPVVLHGHCHLKALVGTSPAKAALGLLGGEVQEVDSACCGMAGAFGYEKEHYDISKKLAQRRLVDAMRAAPEEAVLVASGTSCRHQINDFAGRQAVHPAEALAGRLKGRG